MKMTAKDKITALVLERDGGKVIPSIRMINEDDLGDGDVTVSVAYSSLNYKDAMIMEGLGKLVKSYPHVPGIDFSGIVESSSCSEFKPGDRVVLTGWRVGETCWGGYAAMARVKAEWLVGLPDGLGLKQVMAIGTAGLTAMLAVMTLEEHGLSLKDKGLVLVTGAAGGVGSIAVSLLSKLGYTVVASTGRAKAHDYLKRLGASVIIDRNEMERPPPGPLASERWAGAIDTVGGDTLAGVLAAMRCRGCCVTVGMASGIGLETTVLPFIIRGIALVGVDSTNCPMPRRLEAWKRIAKELPSDMLERITHVVPLSEVAEMGGKILRGKVRGRTVIKVGS